MRLQRVWESKDGVFKFELREVILTSGLKLTSKSIFCSENGPEGTLVQRGGRLFVWMRIFMTPLALRQTALSFRCHTQTLLVF